MIQIFDHVDKDQSGSLSKEEIYQIVKEIGVDRRKEIDNCLRTMLVNVKAADADPLPLPSPQSTHQGCCPPSTGMPKEPLLMVTNLEDKEEAFMTKAVFLAWFLHLEKL